MEKYDLLTARLQVLSNEDAKVINGGLILSSLSGGLKLLDKVLKWAGIYDAASDFAAGVEASKANCECCQ